MRPLTLLLLSSPRRTEGMGRCFSFQASRSGKIYRHPNSNNRPSAHLAVPIESAGLVPFGPRLWEEELAESLARTRRVESGRAKRREERAERVAESREWPLFICAPQRTIPFVRLSSGQQQKNPARANLTLKWPADCRWFSLSSARPASCAMGSLL